MSETVPTVAALVALAEHGIPPDIQELLVVGNAGRGIAPGALRKALLAEHKMLVREIEAACGYLLNAKFDLETGCTKATAIMTIDGGLKRLRGVLAYPLPPSQSGGGDK